MALPAPRGAVELFSRPPSHKEVAQFGDYTDLAGRRKSSGLVDVIDMSLASVFSHVTVSKELEILCLTLADGSVVLFANRNAVLPASDFLSFARCLTGGGKGQAPLPEASVVKMGELGKPGRIFGSTKTRFFIFMSHCVLLYFEDATCVTWLGQVNLAADDAEVRPPSGTGAEFAVFADGREYALVGLGRNASKEARTWASVLDSDVVVTRGAASPPGPRADVSPATAGAGAGASRAAAAGGARRHGKARKPMRRVRPGMAAGGGSRAPDSDAAARNGASATAADDGDGDARRASTTAAHGDGRAESAGRASVESRVGAGGAPSTRPKSIAVSKWVKSTDEAGREYWYHRETRETRWERPTEAVEGRIEARREAESAALRERQAQRVARLAEEEKRQRATHAERHEDHHRVASEWVKEWAAGKDSKSMLFTLAEIVAEPRARREALFGSVSFEDASFADTRKAYLKSVRFLHPDKAPDAIAGVAAAVFPVLTERFNADKHRIAQIGRSEFRKSLNGSDMSARAAGAL